MGTSECSLSHHSDIPEAHDETLARNTREPAQCRCSTNWTYQQMEHLLTQAMPFWWHKRYDWLLHLRLLDIVTPSRLVWSATLSPFVFTVTQSKWCLTSLKPIIVSLHLSTFNCSLLLLDHCSTAAEALWISLCESLGTISATVVSSTYYKVQVSSGRRSIIINKNSQGPSFVPWGMPDTQKQSQEAATTKKPTIHFLPNPYSKIF